MLESKSEIDSVIDQVAEKFGSEQMVVKAQIHAGGRGKGGGVKFSPNKEKARENANNILGMTLKTHQTGLCFPLLKT